MEYISKDSITCDSIMRISRITKRDDLNESSEILFLTQLFLEDWSE
jgi:hypothetical protein